MAYLVSGFAIPFVAAYYQLYVSSLVLSGLWGVGGGRLTRAAGASPLARHRSRLARTYRRPANLYMLHPARNRRLDGRAFCNTTRAHCATPSSLQVVACGNRARNLKYCYYCLPGVKSKIPQCLDICCVPLLLSALSDALQLRLPCALQEMPWVSRWTFLDSGCITRAAASLTHCVPSSSLLPSIYVLVSFSCSSLFSIYCVAANNARMPASLA